MPLLATCLTPDCKNSKAFKGLCSSCYKSAKRLVDSEQTTWEALAEMGLADVGESASSKFMDAFKKRKDQ